MSGYKWKWLDGSSVNEIGGRQTDISQIGFTLERLIKQAFPVNSVPTLIAEGLKELHKILEEGEELIEKLVERSTELLEDEEEKRREDL